MPDPAPSAARRTALALLVGGLLLLGVAAPVPAHAAPHAASRAASQLADQVRRADAVFTGRVTGSSAAHRSQGQRGATRTYDVEVQRVYKGHVAAASVQVTAVAPRRSCRLGTLGSGRDYVFLVAEDGADLTADGCSGTARSSAGLVADVEKLLGKGRPPVPPAPRKAVLTPVAGAAPTTFPRLAAPGAAAVLVGLLGLVVVRRLGRHG